LVPEAHDDIASVLPVRCGAGEEQITASVLLRQSGLFVTHDSPEAPFLCLKVAVAGHTVLAERTCGRPYRYRSVNGGPSGRKSGRKSGRATWSVGRQQRPA